LFTISWSGLRRYEECRQMHLRTIEGKTSGAANGRIFLPGTVADRVMREWLSVSDPEPGQMHDMVPAMLERYANPKTEADRKDARVIKWRGDKNEDRQRVLDFVIDVVDRLEPILMEHVIPHDYHPELKFEQIIGIPYLDGRPVGVKLIGGIDIAVRLREPQYGLEPGDFVLWDLKATQNDEYIAKVVGQGIFYDIAFGHWWGDVTQPKRFGFVAPALKEPVQWLTIDDQDRRAMLERVVRFAHGMWQGRWEPKASDEGCSMCEVRHVCDKFQVHMSSDDVGKHRASFAATAKARQPYKPSEVANV
jgi:hypothetical protein